MVTHARPFLILAGTAFVCRAASAAVIPEPYPASRYESMVERSPFALATPAVTPVTPDRNFADGWYWSSLSRLEGKDFVTVRARDLSVQFALWGAEEDRETGVKLQSVEWSPNIGKSTVTIVKDGQFAKLLFNEANLVAPGPGSQPSPTMPSARANGQSPRLGAGNVPMPAGKVPANANLIQPQRPGVVRPNGAAPPQNSVVTIPGAQPQRATGATGTTVPTESGGRRRIRSIPLTPAQ
jgi:hypothetical protein